MSYNPQNPNGQNTMANSAPVVIASDQTAVPVSGTFYQATQPVSGTVDVNILSGSIANTSFEATQATPASLKNQPHVLVSLSQPSYTDGDIAPMSLTLDGNLRVDGSSVTQPVSGSVSISSGFVAVSQSTAANLNATVVGTGTFAVQAAQSGTWNVGTLTSITNAVTVSQGTATSLKTQAESYQGGSAVSSSNPLYTAQLPVASGGVTPVTGSSTGGSSAITIYGSPGQVYGWYFYNANSSVAYVHFYNTASAITVGTTAASYVLPIPGSSGANVFGIGIAHSSSIKIGISTGRSSGTAVSSAVDYNIFYK